MGGIHFLDSEAGFVYNGGVDKKDAMSVENGFSERIKQLAVQEQDNVAAKQLAEQMVTAAVEVQTEAGPKDEPKETQIETENTEDGAKQENLDVAVENIYSVQNSSTEKTPENIPETENAVAAENVETPEEKAARLARFEAARADIEAFGERVFMKLYGREGVLNRVRPLATSGEQHAMRVQQVWEELTDAKGGFYSLLTKHGQAMNEAPALVTDWKRLEKEMDELAAEKQKLDRGEATKVTKKIERQETAEMKPAEVTATMETLDEGSAEKAALAEVRDLSENINQQLYARDGGILSVAAQVARGTSPREYAAALAEARASIQQEWQQFLTDKSQEIDDYLSVRQARNWVQTELVDKVVAAAETVEKGGSTKVSRALERAAQKLHPGEHNSAMEMLRGLMSRFRREPVAPSEAQVAKMRDEIGIFARQLESLNTLGTAGRGELTRRERGRDDAARFQELLALRRRVVAAEADYAARFGRAVARQEWRELLEILKDQVRAVREGEYAWADAAVTETAETVKNIDEARGNVEVAA